MRQLTRGLARWPEVHRSNGKEMFPACISLGLDLAEWTSYIVNL